MLASYAIYNRGDVLLMPCSESQQLAIEKAVVSACERFRPAELAVVDLTFTAGCTVIVKGVPASQQVDFPHAVVEAIIQQDFKVQDFSATPGETGLTFAFHVVTADS